MRKFILFLVRKRLGLKKYEDFRFANQKSGAIYSFSEDTLWKCVGHTFVESGVSLNFLLSDECEIVRVDK